MRLDNPPPVRGFTIVELMVSITVIGLIALTVVGDINRTKYSEELHSSSRMVAGALRSLQARALAASTVQTCMGSSVQQVCEKSAATCSGGCNTAIPPFSLGMVLNTNATGVSSFAEVDLGENDRRMDLTEFLETMAFQKAVAQTPLVTIQSLATNQGSVTNATVTFERQSGAMRIDGCDTPAPYTPVCGGPGEPVSLTVVLRHARTALTRTIRLNATTGKISFE